MNQKINKAGIVCCSNGQEHIKKEQVEQLLQVLLKLGITPVCSDYIYEKDYNTHSSGTAVERAATLMNFYRDETIDAIFDISGGDIAIEILPYLDYQVISESNKQFWGYSDLTTVIQAVFTKTGKTSQLFQIRNLIRPGQSNQVNLFQDYLNGGKELFHFSYQFVRGEQMKGILLGGNIRCMLKLAGTPFWPDMSGKILFLESLSGDIPKLISFFSQLKLLGVWEQVTGVLLGTFTEMEEKGYILTVSKLLLDMTDAKLPVAVTKEIGHAANSKALVIGKNYILKKE